MAEDTQVERKRKKVRSPSYPGINLERAIERAEAVYAKEERHPAPIDALLAHWGYSPRSGPGLVTIAALKKFGLLVDQGAGARREARLTDLALRIILDKREGSLDRKRAIQEAALRPGIHHELWEEYGGTLPSDTNLEYKLTVQRGFTAAAAKEFLRELRDTIEFAKLEESGTISPDDGDKWPQEQETAMTPPPGGGTATPTAPSPTPMQKPVPGTRQDVFSLDEGQVILQWPEHLSSASIEDFESWLELVLRKVKRSVDATPQGRADPDTGEDLAG